MFVGVRSIRPGMRAALIAVLAAAVIGLAVQATPAHAETMYLDFAQGRLAGNWDDCMARVRRALPADGWAVGGEYGAPVRGGYFVAWKGNHGVIVTCDIEPAGGSLFHMTMSGLDEGNRPLIDSLIAQIRQGGDGPGPVTAGPARGIDWGYAPGEHRGKNGQRFSYVCPPNGSPGRVWGTDVYTDDSSLCTAAVHAGLITLARGGAVTIEIVGGQDRYVGSTRSGISTIDYGGWGGSYAFVYVDR